MNKAKRKLLKIKLALKYNTLEEINIESRFNV
jgi:hypothetical protein